VFSGILVGLYGLLNFSITRFPDYPDAFAWGWPGTMSVGWGILGFAAVIAAFVARRKPGRAALICLSCAPMVATGLAHATSTWHLLPNGQAVSNDLSIAGALAVRTVFFIPFLAPWIACSSRGFAAVFLLGSTVFAGIVFATRSKEPISPAYISRRPSIAFEIVTSSANSRSLPTGMPMPIRVTFTPSGFSNRARYTAVASPSTVGFVHTMTS
jgi:hypothetical protein